MNEGDLAFRFFQITCGTDLYFSTVIGRFDTFAWDIVLRVRMPYRRDLASSSVEL